MLLLPLLLALSSPARASCENERAALNDCWEAIGACQAVVDAQKKELSLCKLGLVQTLDQLGMVNLELNDAKDDLRAWYRNPFVMVALGMLVGGVAIGVATK